MESAELSPRARVFVVDDHAAVRQALVMRVAMQPDLEVCGEAASAEEALERIEHARPDVAILDISMRDGNGLDLIGQIKELRLEVRMVVCSMHAESIYAQRALEAGAMGYVNKDQASSQIIEAIRCALAGRIYVSDAIADKIRQRANGDGLHSAPPP